MSSSTYLLAGQASEVERLQLRPGCGSPAVAGSWPRSVTVAAAGPSISGAG